MGIRRSPDNPSQHRTIESGRLAFPNVLSAGARQRLRGFFLCQRLPADRTISSPHIASTFSSTNKAQRRWAVAPADPRIRFFLQLESREKGQRLPAGRDRPGQLMKLRRVPNRSPSPYVRIHRKIEDLFYPFVREIQAWLHHRLELFLLRGRRLSALRFLRF